MIIALVHPVEEAQAEAELVGEPAEDTEKEEETAPIADIRAVNSNRNPSLQLRRRIRQTHLDNLLDINNNSQTMDFKAKDKDNRAPRKLEETSITPCSARFRRIRRKLPILRELTQLTSQQRKPTSVPPKKKPISPWRLIPIPVPSPATR
jgi:hypothetical protein